MRVKLRIIKITIDCLIDEYVLAGKDQFIQLFYQQIVMI